jgi:hypothetical protein
VCRGAERSRGDSSKNRIVLDIVDRSVCNVQTKGESRIEYQAYRRQATADGDLREPIRIRISSERAKIVRGILVGDCSSNTKDCILNQLRRQITDAV